MHELPHHHRPRPARFLALAAALCALGLLVGGTAARGDDGSGREEPTIQLTVDPTSTTTGHDVTLTAVVTATTGYPDGTVTFATIADPTVAIGGQAIAVQPVSGSSDEAEATLTTSFGQGTYAIVAYWTPSPLGIFTFQSTDTTDHPIELDVSDDAPAQTATHTTLSMDPATIVQGQHEALTATVTADDGSTPTGYVIFYDGSQQLGAEIPLVDGVATNPDVGSFGAGPHDLYASYQGTGHFKPSQSNVSSVTVADTSPPPTQTFVDLSVSKPVIRQGDTVDLTAHVTQAGGTIVPPGGEVTFYSSNDCNSGTLHSADQQSSAPVDENGNATLLGVGSWSIQDYTLCASYVGDSFGTSSGTASLRVLAPLKHTTLELTGPASAVYKSSTVFTAHLVDSAGDVPGKTVTIQLGLQSCTATTDATGNVQCTFAATDTAANTVSASFAGDLADGPASDSNDFAVTPAPTTLTVSMNGPTRLQGTLVERNGGAPIANVTLHLSLGGNSCTATTDGSGFASCTIDKLDADSATLAGTSDADARYEQGTFSEEVTIPSTIATTLTYTGPASADFGDPVTFTARLTDGSGGIGGQTITFTLGSQTCSTTTGSDDNVSCSLTITQEADDYTVATHFAGDGTYLSSDAQPASFTVTKEEATLALSGPASVLSGGTVTLTATLREDGTTPVGGRSLTFTFGGATCTATTAGDGAAQCTLPAAGSGSTQARVTFAGDEEYAAPADATTDIKVQLPTVLTYAGPTAGDFDDAVTVKAHLAGQTGGAVANAPVTFTLGSQSCTGLTSESGDATCSLTPGAAAGSSTLHVSYPGDGSILLASSTDPTFTVTPEETTLVLTAPPTAQQGTTITFTATLLEDGTTPVDGRTVTFTYGGAHICTGTTSGGVATCQVTAAALGPLTVSASFASDGFYETATAPAETLYVYAPTPGGGMFVVGDKSATGNITFWGNQWSKANNLSSGGSPSSFKGYALHASTTCGGTWSTDPGNSTPPPGGPLPSYIAVVVASSAAKSGSAISGHEVHVVVVKTSAGYDGNPGHAGSGAVVASIC